MRSHTRGSGVVNIALDRVIDAKNIGGGDGQRPKWIPATLNFTLLTISKSWRG
jgi:hypothetical protein